MPTTIRLEDTVKRELDRLQGDLLAERGERLSHSEILARLLRFVQDRADDFLGATADPPRPTPAEIDRVLAGAPDIRIQTRARDVDRALYGSRP